MNNIVLREIESRGEENIVSGTSIFDKISVNDISDFIREADLSYENGEPIVSDSVYDIVFSILVKKDPENLLVSTVRKERLSEGDKDLDKVTHKTPMLSTDKAYTKEEISAWMKKVADGASDIGLDINDITFSITPKLDGLAGRHQGGVLATRGDGQQGFNVSHVYDIGVKTVNGIKDGNGELVLSKKYFEKELVGKFSHPRNVMVGIVKADTLTEDSQRTLEEGAAYFYHYDELPTLNLTFKELEELDDAYPRFFEELILKQDFEFPIDGFVVVVNNKELSDSMGYNSRHHHSVLAIKEQGEAKTVEVKDVVLQIGRTGRITPVIYIEPTDLSGAIVSRVTGHNIVLLKERGIGKGAKIKVVRSGEVIPYVVDVVVPIESNIEEKCPSCGGEITQVSDAIVECLNTSTCPAQLINAIVYHFSTLGIKNFGGKTVEKIIDSGKVEKLSDIYDIRIEDYKSMGFGERQSEVFIESINEVKDYPVESEKLLASFGIRGLGNRASKSILNFFELDDLIINTPSIESISKIENFGYKTAKVIIEGIIGIREDYKKILKSGIIPIEKEVMKDGILYGKNIVFTGIMKNKGRKEMEDNAESLGANIQKSVTKKTDILVYGEKAGSKLDKARKNKINCLSEEEYTDFIA